MPFAPIYKLCLLKIATVSPWNKCFSGIRSYFFRGTVTFSPSYGAICSEIRSFFFRHTVLFSPSYGAFQSKRLRVLIDLFASCWWYAHDFWLSCLLLTDRMPMSFDCYAWGFECYLDEIHSLSLSVFSPISMSFYR